MASKPSSRVAGKRAPARRILKPPRSGTFPKSAATSNVTQLSEIALHSSSEETERSADGEDEDRVLSFYKSEMAKSNTMLYVTRVSFCVFVVFSMYLLGMLFYFRTSNRSAPATVEKIVYQYAPAAECRLSNASVVPFLAVKRLAPLNANGTSTSGTDDAIETSPSSMPLHVPSERALRGSELKTPGPTDHLLFCFFNHTAYRRRSPTSFDVPLIPAGLCTHVVYTAAGVDHSFMVRWTDEAYDRDQGAYKKFLGLREQHFKVKFLVGLGETWEDWRTFRDIASEHSIIRTFAQNLFRWVSSKTFDGVVLNWRHPRRSDRWRLTDMVREIKSRFALSRLLVSLVLPHDQVVRRNGFDVAKLAEVADFLLFRMYGEHNLTTFGKTTLPVTSEDVTLFPKTIRSEIGRNMLHKTCFVLPLTGLTFTLRNRGHRHVGAQTLGPGQPGRYTKVPGMLAYNELCAGNWSLVSADVFATFAVKGNQWVGYHDADNLRNIMRVVKRKTSVACFALWEVSYDDFDGRCGSLYPIAHNCYRSLRSETDNKDPGWED
ncbi:unnamed protein product [Ixodes hexagonus]